MVETRTKIERERERERERDKFLERMLKKIYFTNLTNTIITNCLYSIVNYTKIILEAKTDNRI